MLCTGGCGHVAQLCAVVFMLPMRASVDVANVNVCSFCICAHVFMLCMCAYVHVA